MKMTAALAATLATVVSVAEAGADASVRVIPSPRDTIPVSVANTPRAVVALYAGSGLDLWTKMMIEDICDRTPFYWDSVQVMLAPGDSVEVNFSPWVPTYPVLHRVTCWTALVGDTCPANDTLRQFFWVGHGSSIHERPEVAEDLLSVTPTVGSSFRFSPAKEPVDVFDVTGGLVWKGHETEWRGVGSDGRSLMPGPYFARSRLATVRLVLVR
jgi:hypothetical protein